MRFTAIDIETTGLGPERDRIIEIGAVKYEDGVKGATFSTLIHPPTGPLPARIVELTGITDEMLVGAPEEEAAMTELFEFLEGEDCILGHNIPFDYSFLKVAAARMGREFAFSGIDTLTISRGCHPELPKKALSSMCEVYGLVNEHAHRAFEDADTAARLFYCLLERFGDTKPELFLPAGLSYTQKKTEPVTAKQIRYLKAIIDQYHLPLMPDYQKLTKSEASRLIDKLLSTYGRIS